MPGQHPGLDEWHLGDAQVLVVGDAATARGARELARGAFKVHEAKDVEQALEVLAQEEIGALVCDLDSSAGDPAARLREGRLP